MKVQDRILVVVPVYVKPEEDAPADLIERLGSIREAVGALYVVTQGEKILFPEDLRKEIFVTHYDTPLGIWGAVYKVWNIYHHNPYALKGIDRIVLNLAPLYFDKEDICWIASGCTDHVVGWREDIASSLSDIPEVGRSRALIECFLTALAGIRIKQPYFSRDGFSGLHAVSVPHFLTFGWDWLRKTTWGGAVMFQIHSMMHRFSLEYQWIPNKISRTWESSLGNDARAVIHMLDQSRHLPIFEAVTSLEIQNALDVFPFVFKGQVWLNTETAKEEVKEILRHYNKHTTQGSFIVN